MPGGPPAPGGAPTTGGCTGYEEDMGAPVAAWPMLKPFAAAPRPGGPAGMPPSGALLLAYALPFGMPAFCVVCMLCGCEVGGGCCGITRPGC